MFALPLVKSAQGVMGAQTGSETQRVSSSFRTARLATSSQTNSQVYRKVNSASNSTTIVGPFHSGVEKWFSGIALSLDSFQQLNAGEIVVASHQQRKNKIVLVLLEISYMGALGVDRMYMGQVGLGLVKLSIGVIAWLLSHLLRSSTCMIVMLIWGVVDWFIVMVNCLEGRPGIHALGFNASFGTPWEATVAFWLAFLGFAMVICPCARGQYSMKSVKGSY